MAAFQGMGWKDSVRAEQVGGILLSVTLSSLLISLLESQKQPPKQSKHSEYLNIL